MKKTKFSCLDMKHRGAEIVSEKTSQMTTKEEVLFWKTQTECLTKSQVLAKQTQTSNLEGQNA